jgi:hypothetical protein
MVVSTEPVRASSPSLIFWPGVPFPTLASPRPRGFWGVMGHKVPCGTDTPESVCYTRYLENSDRLRSLDIRWRHRDASSSRLFKGSAPQNGGYRVQWAKRRRLS